MHTEPPQQVGPLDRGTIAPARSLLLAKLAASALVALLALIGGLLLAPRVLAGVGVLPAVSATVTEVSAVPQSAGCTASTVTLVWGDGQRGSARWCATPAATMPKVGDTEQIWVLSGWSPVQASSRLPWLAFDIVALAVLLAGASGTACYGRELAALARLRAPTNAGATMSGQIDRITIGKGLLGRDGRVTIGVALDGVSYPPLRLTLPGPLDRSLLGARVTVHALRAGRRGGPGGPYVLVRAGTGGAVVTGTRVALGRSLPRC